MIDVKARFDVSILSKPKHTLNGEEDWVKIWMYNSNKVSASYAHFALMECFDHIDSTLVPAIVSHCHYQSKTFIPPMKHKRVDAEEALEKIKKLNQRTGNDLIFTIEEI